MPGEDDLNMRATLDDAVSDVLTRIEARLERLEGTLGEVDVAGRAAGEGVDEGARKGEEGLRREETQAERTRKSVKGLGDETKASGKKTDDATSRWARYEKQLGKTSKTFGGMSWMMRALKWSIFIGGAFAAVSALSALAAAAVTAVAGLGQLVPGLAAVAPIGLAIKLGMKAASMGMEAAQPQVDALKKRFDVLGESVAAGGLRKGLDYMNAHISPFMDVLDDGFRRIGSSLGFGAEAATNFITESHRMDQVNGLFAGFEQILDKLIPLALHLASGLMNLLQAAMPAGIELTGMLGNLAEKFDQWTQRQLASGRAQEVITNSMHALVAAVKTVTNFVVGLFNIFRIGAGTADEMGASIQRVSEQFRAWTESAEGQNKIQEYFTKSQPAIHETVLLIRDLLKMFGGLATSSDVAPIIAQIRTELLPVISQLLQNFSGADGLLPSLISAAAAIGKLFAALDPSALQIIVEALTGLIEGISWLTENVPGASSVLSVLFTGALLAGPVGALGSQVMGIIDTVTGIGGAAQTAIDKFGEYKGYWDEFAGASAEITAMKEQITGATDWVKGLVAEEGLLHRPWTWASAKATAFGTILKTQVAAGMAWVRATATTMWTALMGPIGWVILAIMAVVAVVWYLWENCEWFRDAVTAVWEWIKNAAIVAWNWIVDVVTTVVSAIAAAAVWLWQNGIKPVWDIIAAAAKVVWDIIVFVVKVAVFIIGGIIFLLAKTLEGIWWLISTVAVWVWQNVIWPVIKFVADMVILAWTAVSAFFTMIWNAISTAATAVWNGVIMPVITAVATAVTVAWTAVSDFFSWLWGLISSGADAAWNGAIMPILRTAADIAMAVWRPVRDFLVAIWSPIQSAASACWEGIKSAASTVAGVVKGVWDSVTGVIRGVWNTIANAWNGIPSLTIPDWVPLVGGSTLSLPKLPTLWHGGKIAFDSAIVGELGPEPLLNSSGRFMGMLGENGPEVATGLPRGGYVVPNLDTLTRMPGLLHKLPAGVGAAVASAVPGYADVLGRRDAPAPPPPPAPREGDSAMAAEVAALARAVTALADRPPPISASGPDVEDQVFAALRRWENRKELRKRYGYGPRRDAG